MFDFTFSTMIWLALCALFVILEAATVNLVSVWFAIGALAALVNFLPHRFSTYSTVCICGCFFPHIDFHTSIAKTPDKKTKGSH